MESLLLSQWSLHAVEAAESKIRCWWLSAVTNSDYWRPHQAVLTEWELRRRARCGLGSTIAYHFSSYYHLMRLLFVTITVHQPIQDKDQGDDWVRGSSVSLFPVYWLNDLKKFVAVVVDRRCQVNSVRVDVVSEHYGAAQHHHAFATTRAAASWTAGVDYWIRWPASFCCCTLVDYCCWRR